MKSSETDLVTSNDSSMKAGIIIVLTVAVLLFILAFLFGMTVGLLL